MAIAAYNVNAKLSILERVLGSSEPSRDGVNFAFKCPVCAKVGSQKKKLVIKIDTGLVHCWVCGWSSRSVIPLLRKFTTQDVLESYVTLTGGKPASSGSRPRTQERRRVSLPDGFMMLIDAPFFWPDVKGAWRYVFLRGLTVDDVWRYRMGLTLDGRYSRRIIVPSFDVNGNLNFFSARAIDNDRVPKYDAPKVDKLSIVFNEIDVDWKSRVTLCEGVFDAIACGDNAIPLLGSDVNEKSHLLDCLLINDTPVALALDADMIGTKVEKIVKLLESYCVDVKVVDMSGASDPGAMSKDEFSDRLKNAKYRTWQDSFKLRLNRAMQVHV